MKGTALFLFLAASVATAQSNGRPATASKAPQHHAAASTAAARAAASKLPAGIPAVHGIVKTAFALKYQDYKAGTGALAEPNKLYRVQYTGYLAATGQKFDSSYDHRAPVMSDGKPVMGADGKPQLGEAQPMVFPQGYGRLIPGFDQGFEGMHVGGKRRIFIPWELGYGMRSVPARGDSPGIPPKSDLIFDVDAKDLNLPCRANHVCKKCTACGNVFLQQNEWATLRCRCRWLSPAYRAITVIRPPGVPGGCAAFVRVLGMCAVNEDASDAPSAAIPLR